MRTYFLRGRTYALIPFPNPFNLSPEHDGCGQEGVIAENAGKKKYPKRDVVGRADLIIFPISDGETHTDENHRYKEGNNGFLPSVFH
jgi:hypothetical protein